MNKFNIFIPAAGLGERLRPITDHIPKPLLPLLGKPAIEHVLDRVLFLDVNRVIINLYYKKELIEQWFSDYFGNVNNPHISSLQKRGISKETIAFFHEERILGTGGALKNAEGILGQGTFLVHNSDVISDIELSSLVEFHHSSGNLVTLAVHDYPEFNTVYIDKEGLLKFIGRDIEDDKAVAFTGIAVYDPAFLRYLPSGSSSVVNAWLTSVAEGGRIGTKDVTGCFWSDIGTPSSYSSAVFRILKNDGEAIFIDKSKFSCRDVKISGNVVIEKDCTIDKGVSLKNCIIFPGSHIRENSRIENCIAGKDFRVDMIESEVFRFAMDKNRRLIGAGGSDRKYFRIKKDGTPRVLMECNEDDKDFERHMEYSEFFRKFSVPVPEVIEKDPEHKCAIFEDVGDISLYSWLKCQPQEREIEDIYKRIIDVLVSIHRMRNHQEEMCSLLKDRLFDYDHFRWETSYFIQRFIQGIKNIQVQDSRMLEAEFHMLAERADSYPKTVMHRDFQSQNIMVTPDNNINIIDFQGARVGPPAYDVVSLLWDPYYRLKDDLRERLQKYYIRLMKERGAIDINEPAFSDMLLTCRLQRHMQALGAFGYLSLTKGKKHFLKHIPEGIRLLKEDIALANNVYPTLFNLIVQL